MDNHEVYLHTLSYARDHGEIDQYKNSDALNQLCAQAIDKVIHDRPEANYLPPKEMFAAVEDEFGKERIDLVLANTIQQKYYDGRFSHENKSWANALPSLPNGRHCVAEAHPVFIDGLVTRLRRLAAEQAMAAVEGKSTKAPSVMAKLETAKHSVKPPAQDAPGKSSMDR